MELRLALGPLSRDDGLHGLESVTLADVEEAAELLGVTAVLLLLALSPRALDQRLVGDT